MDGSSTSNIQQFTSSSINFVSPQVQQEIMSGDDWILLSPLPGSQPPLTHTPRPPGCKTIFCGGVPLRLCQDTTRGHNILMQIFSKCDQVRQIRINPRRFAHIRFLTQSGVDASLRLSSTHLVIDKDEVPNECSGRLHIDFSNNNEDLLEFDAEVRRDMTATSLDMEGTREGSPNTPQPFTTFSNYMEAVSYISDLLKSNTSDSVSKACGSLLFWLERGELTRRNAQTFYTLLQSTHSHIRRLLMEKHKVYEDLQVARQRHSQKMDVIIRQIKHIRQILETACKQRCSDNFSKPQRRNLQSWKEYAQEVHEREQYEYLSERKEDEMDLESDGEDQSCQFEVEHEPVSDVIQSHHSVQQQSSTLQFTLDDNHAQSTLSSHVISSMVTSSSTQTDPLPAATVVPSSCTSLPQQSSHKRRCVDQDDATNSSTSSSDHRRLLCIVSIFLHAHPRGATLHYIHNYLVSQGYQCRLSHLDEALTDNESLFYCEQNGEGANIQTKWFFKGVSYQD